MLLPCRSISLFFFFFFIPCSYFPCQEQAEINLSKLLNLRGKHNPKLGRHKQVTAAGVCTLGDYTRHICILLVKYVFTSANHRGACGSFTSWESLSFRHTPSVCHFVYLPKHQQPPLHLGILLEAFSSAIHQKEQRWCLWDGGDHSFLSHTAHC